MAPEPKKFRVKPRERMPLYKLWVDSDRRQQLPATKKVLELEVLDDVLDGLVTVTQNAGFFSTANYHSEELRRRIKMENRFKLP